MGGRPLNQPDDLPAFFRSADRQARVWQRWFQRVQIAQILLLILVAIGGATAWRLGSVEVSAWIGAVALGGALLLRLMQSQSRPEERWYEGRAAAESAKTVSWRFAVGAEPFPARLGDVEAGERLVEQLREFAGALPTISEPAGTAQQITVAMRATRAAPLPERIRTYRTGRLDDQLRWYSDRAAWNRRQALGWGIAVAGLEIAALVAALLRLATSVELDWLGIFATAATGVVAWLQIGQHEQLARAYSIASHELACIRDLVRDDMDEAAWAALVDQAEAAISREHTLWLAASRPSQN